MSENKNEKKTIWIYAVILFTSAFIVLLLTAYSQIKFNKNIDEYRNKISSEANEKKNFQMNLNQALEANKKLTDELKTVKEELIKVNAQLEESKKAYEKDKNDSSMQISYYQTVTAAQNEYNRGNIIGCAEIISSLNKPQIPDEQAQELLNSLKERTYKKAAYQLFLNGYDKYINKYYDEAIKNLSKAREFAPNEYYSDDCLYYIGYSQYRAGNPLGAVESFEKLIKEYGESNYRRDAEDMLKWIK